MAELLRVDGDKKQIHTSIGTLGYDILVLALGATTNYFGNKEIETNSLAMKSVSQAIRMKIFILEAADRLLAPMSDFASKRATQYLQKMGVTVKVNAAIEGYNETTITLNTGEKIASRTVLWAAGVKVNEIPGLDKAARGRGGRMAVDSFNRLSPFENIYVVGDQAIMTEEAFPNGHPQVAQPAIQQAGLLAQNLLRSANNLELIPFSYHDKGSMATVGRNKAVVDIGRLHIGGFIAWLIWILVHLMAIVGTKNRFFIFINWAWNYLTYDQSLRLIIRSAAPR